jgi:hypothetical protein
MQQILTFLVMSLDILAQKPRSEKPAFTLTFSSQNIRTEDNKVSTSG